MSQTNEKLYVAEDYWDLPDGERAELIGGKLIKIPMPSLLHQKMVLKLSIVFENYVRGKGNECVVILGPFAVNLNMDEKTYVEPDISVVCDKSKLTDREYKGAPDFIVEIASSSSRRHDHFTKHALYFNAGVREYWIVDPEKECTTVYNYEEDYVPMIIPFQESVVVGIFDNLEVTIADLL